jgi:small conductance mechanosensitive channel
VRNQNMGVTLAVLIGNVVRLVVIAFIIITLENFGITIALVGAPALGATLAIQGPLSNYSAGFQSY